MGEAMIRGARWPMFKDGHAPILFMSPTAEMSGTVWRKWLDRYDRTVLEPGVDGTHTPLQAEWRGEVKRLARLNAEHGKVSAFWLEGDNDGDDAGSTFDGWDALTEGTQRLFDELSDVPGSKILGISYDVHERQKQHEVDRWLGWCGLHRPDKWLFCARALPNTRYGGDVASWEDHLPTLDTMDAILVAEILRSHHPNGQKKAVWNTERNRARNNGEGKDTTEDQMPAMIRIARQRNVGLIMGIQGQEGGVSDYGTAAPQRPEEFRVALGADSPEDPPKDPPKDHRALALSKLTEAEAEITAARAEINQI